MIALIAFLGRLFSRPHAHPPATPSAAPPAVAPAPAPAATVTPPTPAASAPAPTPALGEQLRGPLRYMIGTDNYVSVHDGVLEVAWGQPVALWSRGPQIAYCNLFNEKYSEQSAAQRAMYAPYLRSSDTAEEYGEGQIDPAGPGWMRNITEQFRLRHGQGFKFVELDNPDAYGLRDVIAAVQLAHLYELQVVAKNPGLCEPAALRVDYVRSCAGIIVEKDCGALLEMNQLRCAAGRPRMPIWFVFFDKPGSRSGLHAAQALVTHAAQLECVGVTYSESGEYENVADLLVPRDTR